LSVSYCNAPRMGDQSPNPIFDLRIHHVVALDRLGVKMDDGTEAEFGPGNVSHLPPGHDAWVVGNEPVIVIDVTGMTHYAEQHR
jgi:hypothetical protein